VLAIILTLEEWLAEIAPFRMLVGISQSQGLELLVIMTTAQKYGMSESKHGEDTIACTTVRISLMQSLHIRTQRWKPENLGVTAAHQCQLT
jgi:hypothetical protein